MNSIRRTFGMFRFIPVAFMPFVADPATGSAVESAARPPNIIVILADDLGYGSLGCYGNEQVKTPNIDQLAAGGVRLTGFHSNGAMCTPTRAALLTGRYPQRCAWVPDAELSPVYREQRAKNPRQRWAWGISTNEFTLPEMLAKAGYRTALIGKWHLGYDLAFHPLEHGFHEFRGFVGGGVDYHTHIATHGSNELDWWNNKEIRNEEGYTTDLLTRHATGFIDRNKSAPFFLLIAHAAPHSPWQGRDVAGRKSPVETYKEMIAILDESVGAIVGTLRKHRLCEDTLVIFGSDNGAQPPRGFPANRPLQGAKGSMLEGGHRVPFVAHWPGVIPGGGTSDEPAMTMDLLPTFARLAGATIPEHHVIDGIDIMPILKGGRTEPERVLHWKHGDAWALRKGPWKLMSSGGKGRTLVNLAEDLAEKNNLMGLQPDLAARLAELHQQWVAEVGDR